MFDIFSYSFGINAIVGGFLCSILLGIVGVLITANKAHNLVGSPFLGDEDNHFFEGFTFATDKDPDYDKIPVYFLDTGS